MSMKVVLENYGFTEDQVGEMLSGMEVSLGRLSIRTVSENLMEDRITGQIRITKHAEVEYRRLFALAGMNIDDYLRDKQTFFKAFRTANSLAFDRFIIQSGLELPFLK